MGRTRTKRGCGICFPWTGQVRIQPSTALYAGIVEAHQYRDGRPCNREYGWIPAFLAYRRHAGFALRITDCDLHGDGGFSRRYGIDGYGIAHGSRRTVSGHRRIGQRSEQCTGDGTGFGMVRAQNARSCRRDCGFRYKLRVYYSRCACTAFSLHIQVERLALHLVSLRRSGCSSHHTDCSVSQRCAREAGTGAGWGGWKGERCCRRRKQAQLGQNLQITRCLVSGHALHCFWLFVHRLCHVFYSISDRRDGLYAGCCR